MEAASEDTEQHVLNLQLQFATSARRGGTQQAPRNAYVLGKAAQRVLGTGQTDDEEEEYTLMLYNLDDEEIVDVTIGKANVNKDK